MLRVEESLWLWRALSLNVTPKVHAAEDHLCQQVCRLNGIGDLGEDFLEQSHQEGIKDHARSKNAKGNVPQIYIVIGRSSTCILVYEIKWMQ